MIELETLVTRVIFFPVTLLKLRRSPKKKSDSYCCAIKAMVDQTPQPKSVGHVPGEISGYVCFFS